MSKGKEGSTRSVRLCSGRAIRVKKHKKKEVPVHVGLGWLQRIEGFSEGKRKKWEGWIVERHNWIVQLVIWDWDDISNGPSRLNRWKYDDSQMQRYSAMMGVGPNVGPSLMTSRCGGEDKSGSFRSADCQLTKPGAPIRKLRLGLQLIWFISCPFICFKNSFVKKYEYWIEIVRLVFLWLPWMQFSRLIWHNLTIPTSPFTQVILWCSFVLWQNESGKVWKPVEW